MLSNKWGYLFFSWSLYSHVYSNPRLEFHSTLIVGIWLCFCLLTYWSIISIDSSTKLIFVSTLISLRGITSVSLEKFDIWRTSCMRLSSWGQCMLVSHQAHTIKDFERSYVPHIEFDLFSKSYYSFPRRDSQNDLVFDLEFKSFLWEINIFLLSVASGP